MAVGSLPDVRLFRNNVGELPDRRGIPVRYGLLIGSADTIGLVAPRGRMLSLEFKRPGYKPAAGNEAEAQQQAWRDMVNGFGGIALRVDSTEQALFGVVLARHHGELPPGTVYPLGLLTVTYARELDDAVADWERRKAEMTKGKRK